MKKIEKIPLFENFLKLLEIQEINVEKELSFDVEEIHRSKKLT